MVAIGSIVGAPIAVVAVVQGELGLENGDAKKCSCREGRRVESVTVDWELVQWNSESGKRQQT